MAGVAVPSGTLAVLASHESELHHRPHHSEDQRPSQDCERDQPPNLFIARAWASVISSAEAMSGAAGSSTALANR
jgi:hypothetical protein